MDEQPRESDEYRAKLRALDQELTSATPIQKRNWLPILAGALLLFGIVGLGSWSLSRAGFFAAQSVQGPAGPRGPQGPPGPPGAAAATGSGIRFAEFGCVAPTCLLSCNDAERIINAYALTPGGSFTFENDRSVTFRPVRRPSNKIVLVCGTN